MFAKYSCVEQFILFSIKRIHFFIYNFYNFQSEFFIHKYLFSILFHINCVYKSVWLGVDQACSNYSSVDGYR